ncbi:ribosomal protein S18-alanine N-acetyltransferase, partial [Desulfovibrio sp. OttesenSCG-928-C14]|nr:ribosomal protein S18-alanine N-acetyltransferase [Desulfovibrio sp. OttesenSCG-928-C14]
MKAAPLIRKARREDLESILAFESSGFAGDAFSRRQLRYLLTRAQGLCLAALAAGEVAGYICVLTGKRRRNARIYSLAVAPEYRRTGIAEALIAEAVNFAQARGLTYLSLEVRADNPAALRLYEKLGFTQKSVIPAYYHDGMKARRMV